jgi:hypothetical protein
MEQQSQRELVRMAVDMPPHGQQGRAIPPRALPGRSYVVPAVDVVPPVICTRAGVFWSVVGDAPGPEPGTTRLVLWPLETHSVKAHTAVDLPGGILS